MSFAYYLLAFLLPPVYLLVRGKYVSGIVNGLVWLASFPLMLMFGIGFFPWLACVGHALWTLGQEMRQEHVEQQAEAIARRMNSGDHA